MIQKFGFDKTRWLSAALLLGAVVGPGMALAQQFLPRPTVLSVFPAGGKAGTTVEVKIMEATELEEATGLIFNHPGIKATPVMTTPDRFYPEPRPVPNKFNVTIEASTPPGTYELRASIGAAISNARRFVVGDLPEIAEVEDNNSKEKATPIEIGQTANGLFATDFDYFKFSAKQGQRLTIQCAAERIDSRGDAVLALQDASGRELARNHDAIGRDPLLDFTAPADGEYLIRLNELSYATGGGSGTAPYRLTIGSGPWIDFFDPPAIPRGKASNLTLYGRNIGGTPSDVKVGGVVLEKISVTVTPPSDSATIPAAEQFVLAPAAATVDRMIYRHPAAGGLSNPISLLLTDADPVAEVEPNDKPENAQAVVSPAEIIGRFARAGDVDSFSFEAKQGEEFWIEADSQRLGMPTDLLLVIQQFQTAADGKVSVREINTADDQLPTNNLRIYAGTTDPAFKFTAPADGRFRILVRDQFNFSGNSPAAFYRLKIRPPRPGFRVVAIPGLAMTTDGQQVAPRALSVGAGGGAELSLIAYRLEGFEGEIEVRAEGLPTGVTASPTIIGPAASMSSLLLQAAADAQASVSPLKVTATATVQGQPQTREVPAIELLFNPPQTNNPLTPARQGPSIVLAVDNKLQMPARIEVTQTTLRMSRGGKLEIPVKFQKLKSDFNGNVQASFIALPPRINQANVNMGSGTPEGKIALDIPQDLLPGRYTMFLRGETDLNYRRREDLMERAKTDRERIVKLAQELTQAYQKSQQDRQKAEQTYQTALPMQTNANADKTKTAQAAQQAQQTADQAATAANQAKQALDSANQKKADAEKKLAETADDNPKAAAQTELDAATKQATDAQTAYDKAAKAAEDAVTKAKQAADAAKAADEKATTATAAVTAADEARKKAQAAEAQAKTDRDMGEQKRQEIENVMRQAENIARQQPVKTPVHSNAFVVEVTPMPGQLKLSSDQVTVTAGQAADLTATVQREFDFKGEITFTVQPPSGASGWQLAQNAKIEKDKNDGQFQLKADANAKPGEYLSQFVARMQFNNRQVEYRMPLKVTVAAAN